MSPEEEAVNTRMHYGWWMLAIGWLIYGLGVAPGYYSWGVLAEAAMPDLGMDRARVGLVFGIFTLLYSTVAPLSGLLVQRFGVRSMMTLGSLVAATGFFLTSRAETVVDALLGFSLLGGLGLGLGIFVPVQSLGTNWFIRYRATAIAVLMTAGGIFGKFVPTIDEWMVANHSWRAAWLFAAGCSVFVALLALVFVRNTPESIGLQPDLGRPAPATDVSGRSTDRTWTARAAMRTRQFVALIFCGMAFATPWGVAIAHGTLHLRDQQYTTAAAGGIIGWMIFASIGGRAFGFIGDLMKPQQALGLALALEAVGMLGFLFSDQQLLSLLSAMLLGLGFGAAYVSVSVTFGAFFGRRAFAVTAGTRMMFTGVVNAAMPPFAGWAFDRSGSYVLPFLIVASLAAAGACMAWILPDPGPGPDAVDTSA